jgi:hypothetical protein
LQPCKLCGEAIDGDACEQEFRLCSLCLSKIRGEFDRPQKKQKPDVVEPAPADHGGWELKGSTSSGSNQKLVRHVVVDHDLAQHAKPHQKEGVEFLWNNCFSDFNVFLDGDESTVG